MKIQIKNKEDRAKFLDGIFDSIMALDPTHKNYVKSKDFLISLHNQQAFKNRPESLPMKQMAGQR